MKYKALIFDFDYTLGDATDGIVSSFNYAFNNLNMPEYEREAIRRTIGLTLRQAFIKLTDCNDENTINRFLEFFKENADKIMTENTILFPDTITTLKHFRDNQIKIGIVTTKFHYRIVDVLKKYNISDMIDVIIGGEDVTQAKPSPEGLYIAVERLNTSIENILYIGDSIVDAKTALNAKADFAAVTTGTTTDKDFLLYPYKYLFSSLTELTNLH